MVPWPTQRGQTISLLSPSDGRSLWRDISISPKRDMRPIWTLALSIFTTSRRRFSTCLWFFGTIISIKSITTRPPRSRSRNCRPTSSHASRLVLVAVSSISLPLVARAELISIEIKASVWSITIAPPEGRRTSR